MKKTPKPNPKAPAAPAKKAAKKAALKTPAPAKEKAAPDAKKTATSTKSRVLIRWPESADAAVAGSFNDWQPKPLKAVKKGGMELALSLPPGTYEYRLVINGHWMADPACEHSVPNPYGGHNSVLTVK